MMNIPDFWAEASGLFHRGTKQITVRRLGWSNDSQNAALLMAEARVNEALAQLSRGEKPALRERNSAYNGAIGMPIREEVLSRHGEEVITRNGYGAHCLNSPRALFADIDFEHISTGRKSGVLFLILLILGSGLGFFLLQAWWLRAAIVIISVYLAYKISGKYDDYLRSKQPDPVDLAKDNLYLFLKQHPQWSVRLYRTPNGLRLLATHQIFQPDCPQVQAFFAHIGADPIYVQMCLRQNCFRARLTAKPWRMGIDTRLNLRRGWPVTAERQEQYDQWIRDYERCAEKFAACHYIESMGAGQIHPEIAPIIDLHDRESKALYHTREMG